MSELGVTVLGKALEELPPWAHTVLGGLWSQLHLLS